MAIIRYNPWDVFPSFRDDFMSLPEEAAMNVYETDDDVVVEVKAPGFTEKDVKITAIDRSLTVEGELHKENEEKDDKGKKWVRREIQDSRFARTVTLPSTVRSEDADAVFENGILKITLPKAEESKPKTIQIKAKNY
jgi:HSP20 family protein